MFTAERNAIRQPAEAELLRKALAGDAIAVNNVFQYLSSTNAHLRQIMIETLHDLSETNLWQHLLRCLATQCWDSHRDSDRRADPDSSKQIDLSIVEAFIIDKSLAEKDAKESALRESRNDPQILVSYASAYLSALRGDASVIPFLDEMIDIAPKTWKIRAIRALGTLKDERCGMPLIKALAMDDSALHAEAKQALHKLGSLVEPAWQKALEHPNSHIRWHAARGIGDPGNVRSLEILAEGLMDENHAVRWASADVLARIGQAATPAILKALSQNQMTNPFRQAAYHALHGVTSRKLRERLHPLLSALQSTAASVEAPVIAQRLLMDWENGNGT